MTSFDWTPIRYRNVISVLKNPFYAGAYAYGKSEKRTADRRWPGAQELRALSSPSGLGGAAQGSSRGLHRLGGVRTQSGAARHQCLWPYGRCEVRPRRPRLARRPAGLPPLRASARRRLHRTLQQPPSIDAIAATSRWRASVYDVRRPSRRCGVARELMRAVEPMAIEAAFKAGGCTARWSDKPNIAASWSWNSSRRATRHRLPSAATPPAIPTIG